MKLAIGVGIGLFITLVGLREAGIVVNDPATGIALGDLTSGPALIALGGHRGRGRARARATSAARSSSASLAATGARPDLRRARRAGRRSPRGRASGDFSTIGDALEPDNLARRADRGAVPAIFALFMTDFFDTVGTAVAVGTRRRADSTRRASCRAPQRAARRLRRGGGRRGDGRLERDDVRREGAGVAEGARTGLASLVTAGLFALAIFFVPLIARRRPGGARVGKT